MAKNGRIIPIYPLRLEANSIFVTGHLYVNFHAFPSRLLAISAPKKATPGETVTITVNQKGTSNPVSDVNVWAIDFANAKSLKEKLAEARTANKGNLQNADWEPILKDVAISLKTTDANGQVTHQFDKGRYPLVAIKKGSVPAYAGIVVAPPTIATSPSATASTQ